MKIFICTVIALILGAVVLYTLLAYDPFGLRYDYSNLDSGLFYRIDKLTGETLLCRPISLSELTCTKAYDFKTGPK